MLGHWSTICLPPDCESTFAVTAKGVQFQVRVAFDESVKVAEVVVPLPAALPVPDHPVQMTSVPLLATKSGTLIVRLPRGNIAGRCTVCRGERRICWR